jgi:hypothetical protein
MSFVNWGAAPIGSLVGGLTATAIGLRPTLLLAGLATFLALRGDPQNLPAELGSAWLLFSPLRTLRTIPEVSPR